MISFGLIPEFIGRLPVVASLDELSEDQLVQVLTEPKNAMVKQYTKLLGMDGVNLNITKDALRALASEAIRKGTGARALRSMIERIMLDVMFDCPSRDDISEVTLNRAVVEGKKSPLLRRKQEKTPPESSAVSHEGTKPRRKPIVVMAVPCRFGAHGKCP